MSAHFGIEQCESFINCHLRAPGAGRVAHGMSTVRRAVTISRQSGCGAHRVAENLALYLHEHGDGTRWAVFDRNLVEKVLQDHNLSPRLAAFMPEDRFHGIDDTLDELFGLHPPSHELVRQTAETILRLVDLGNVIIIGRGANVITAKLDYVLHVRLVGSLQQRCRRYEQAEHLSEVEALRRIDLEDAGRRRYLHQYFHRDQDDPLLHHLIINTDRIPCEQAAAIIGNVVLNFSAKPHPALA